MTAKPRRAPVPRAEERPLLPLMAAAGYLGIGASTAYRLARAGHFPVEVITLAGKKQVRTADLRRYLGLDN